MHTYSPAAPLISCTALATAELHRRADLAESQQEAMQATYNRPSAVYGREIMWHPAYAAECVAQFSGMPLYEVGPWLLDCQADACNAGQALDLTDYGYLADVLREGLASNPTPLAALRLGRALAWVEQAGAALLPTAQGLLTASRPEAFATLAAPALAA